MSVYDVCVIGGFLVAAGAFSGHLRIKIVTERARIDLGTVSADTAGELRFSSVQTVGGNSLLLGIPMAEANLFPSRKRFDKLNKILHVDLAVVKRIRVCLVYRHGVIRKAANKYNYILHSDAAVAVYVAGGDPVGAVIRSMRGKCGDTYGKRHHGAKQKRKYFLHYRSSVVFVLFNCGFYHKTVFLSIEIEESEEKRKKDYFHSEFY